MVDALALLISHSMLAIVIWRVFKTRDPEIDKPAPVRRKTPPLRMR